MSVKITRKNPEAIQKIYGDMKKADGLHVAVGFPKGKARAYPDGEEVAFVAACHVYGYGVPTRDFMALAKEDIIKNTRPILSRIQETKASKPEVYMEAAGQKAKEAIQKAITDLKDPPLSPVTIELRRRGGAKSRGDVENAREATKQKGWKPASKGEANPLIDTEHMRGSVDYEVRQK